MNTKTAVLAAIIGLYGLTTIANAESVRCGADLVREGMLSAVIKEKCGEPRSIEVTSEPVLERRVDGTSHQIGAEVVEYWYYDFGSRQFPVRMTFRGGVAEKIELVSRNR